MHFSYTLADGIHKTDPSRHTHTDPIGEPINDLVIQKHFFLLGQLFPLFLPFLQRLLLAFLAVFFFLIIGLVLAAFGSDWITLKLRGSRMFGIFWSLLALPFLGRVSDSQLINVLRRIPSQSWSTCAYNEAFSPG